MPETPSPRGPWVKAAGLVATGALAGGVLAGTLTANADDSTSTTTPTPSAATQPGVPGNPFSHQPVRSDETRPSSDTVATLRAKAEARVSGGTVYRIESDAGDGAYEAHMRKSDGTLVTVKFDKNLDITAVEDGMGEGDPMSGGPDGRGGPGGPGAPDDDDAASGTAAPGGIAG